MLSSYKKAYEQCADSLITENWRKMNKNDLINRYIEVEGDKELANAYISAIIVRYWGALSKYYVLSRTTVSEDIYYNWLIDAILYAIKKRKWLDPTNKLYNDPSAPDKVINRVLASERLIFYQSSNTHKRRQNFTVASLDEIQDSVGDCALPIYEESQLSEGNIDIAELINSAIREKEYLLAFMVDSIVNYNPFDREKDNQGCFYSTFSKKKLKRHLRALNSTYCNLFAEMYHVDNGEVLKAADQYKEMSRSKLDRYIDKNMKKLYRRYVNEVN